VVFGITYNPEPEKEAAVAIIKKRLISRKLRIDSSCPAIPVKYLPSLYLCVSFGR
jgi:hypothetical protein